MTKILTDSESQVQLISRKLKWVGHPSNNSDIGYPEDWDIIITSTGPFNPNEDNENEKD